MLILLTVSLDNYWILLGENWFWSLSGHKGLNCVTTFTYLKCHVCLTFDIYMTTMAKVGQTLQISHSTDVICALCSWMVYIKINCRLQEEPAILFSKLLLRTYVNRQRSLGLPLRMNGMHRTQFDHACLDLPPFIIWSRVFWLSVMWNLCKAQRWSKSISLPPALHNLWSFLVCTWIYFLTI